ncbi:hypothetical protein [Lentzea californiensis]|uniref:hypothetical protein n=1 Tax=Lentzea californiensis TaxID=438851 RepID=UPI00216587AD|nr:hypothetical protein [Lentzea californiensis]MCR3752665.1 hypothetical protein [Lentzea californiensis]
MATFHSAEISDRVPLSQRHGGRRVVALSLTLADDQWTDDAKKVGIDIRKSVGVGKPGEETPVNAAAYAELFRRMLRNQGARALELAGVDEAVAILHREPNDKLAPSKVRELLTNPTPVQLTSRTALEMMRPPIPFTQGIGVFRGSPVAPEMEIRPFAAAVASTSSADDTAEVAAQTVVPISLPAIPELSDALAAVARGHYLLPIRKWPGRIELLPYEPPAETNPTFFLIEEYAITSKLGDFGLGRTTGPYSLFPGETTEISMKTWLTTTDSFTEGSSIVDSFGTTSADKFNTTLANHTATSGTPVVGSAL